MAGTSRKQKTTLVLALVLQLVPLTDAVQSGRYDVQGYDCKGTATYIWCPSSAGMRNVVLFAHGKAGWRDSYGKILQTVASQGHVVIAPGTLAGVCHSSDDLLIALKTSSADTSLHKCLEKADFSKPVGVMGHSMGAKHLAEMIKNAPASANIGAAVLMHGATKTDGLATPSMFMTAADDTIATSDVGEAFRACSASHKVLTNQLTGGHKEPEEHGRLNLYAARFLSCHLRGARTHCHVIYGTGGGTVCQAEGVAYKDPLAQNCVVVGTNPRDGGSTTETNVTRSTDGCDEGGVVWNRRAEGYTCGGRIRWSSAHLYGGDITAAKAQVAAEYPSICGSCASTVTATSAPSADRCEEGGLVWNRMAEGYTCGDRIRWSTIHLHAGNIDAAKAQVAAEYPSICECDGARRLTVVSRDNVVVV